MSVTVRVPPVFRPLTSGESTVSVEGATVAQVLASLDAAYPGFSSKLLSDDGSLVRYVNLFVDTIKLDGRLLKYAKKHKLDPIVAP